MNTDKPTKREMVAEELPKLLFELSHGWRLEILLSIKGHEMRHTEISKVLKISPQETTRHLVRMTEMRLIQKNVDGKYHLTNLGQLVLAFVPALNVISENSNFFLAHDFSGIPYEFILRLGELAETTVTNTDTLSTVQKVIQLVGKSKERIWMMNVGRLELPSDLRRKGNGLQIRCILPTKFGCDFSERIGLENCRYLEDVRLSLILADELGAFCLPDLEGKMDYTTYVLSKNPASMKWFRELFEYYWTTANHGKT